jgi:hypothetical protein
MIGHAPLGRHRGTEEAENTGLEFGLACRQKPQNLNSGNRANAT